MLLKTASLPSPGWDEFSASCPGASVYLKSQWCLLAARVFGHEPYFISAHDGGEIVGVLPLVRLRTALFGDYMVSLPLFNYGGALARTSEIATALMEEAGALGTRLGTSHVEFRDREPRAGAWQVRTDKVAMVLKLPASEELLLKQLGSKLRSQIKRAERENPTVAVGGAELIEDFYSVFAETMRDLGTPVYPVRLFRDIAATFPEACKIVVVSIGHRPVAAGWLIFGNGTVEVPWAACRTAAKPLAMNMRLYWEMLRVAVAAGGTSFDFGRSSTDAGTMRFKQQWGAQPEQLHWHYWLRNGASLPNITVNNAKYRMAIAAWQRLPIWLTKVIGPRIVRGLP